MDAATFVVTMIDKISAPAHASAKAVEQLNKRLEKTGKLGNKSFTGALAAKANRRDLGLFLKDRVGGAADRGIKRLTDGMLTFGKYAAIGAAVAGVAIAAFVIKGATHMAMFAEATKMAFGLLTGDKAIGEKVFNRTVQLSKQLGLDVEETAHSMQKLLAMQFSPPDAEKWVKLGSDLRAVGVQGDAVQRVMLDIAHVKATGKLSQRNVNMFANAGVSAQLLMEEVGKAMGTNEAGAVAAMHKGKVTSAIALPALERAIMRKTHEHVAGEAGTGFAQNTLTGLVDQLKNAPKLFFLRVADAASSAISKLKPLVSSIMHEIDSFDVASIAKFVGAALDMMRALVPLGSAFVSGFMEGMDAINEVMGGIDPAKTSLQTARDLGHAVAEGFALALRTLQKIADVMVWMDKHRTAVTAGVGVLAVTRVAGASNTVTGVAKMAGWIAQAATWAWKLFGVTGMLTTAWAAVSEAVMGVVFLVAGITGVGIGAAAAIVGGVVIAIAAAGYAIYAYWDEIKAFFVSLGTWFADIGKLWGSALWDGIKGAFDSIKSMLGFTTVSGVRGMPGTDQLGAASQAPQASQAPNATPTPLLAGIEKNGVSNRTENNVRTGDIIVQVDGKDKDGKELGQAAGSGILDHLHQFFQSHSLEAGASGAK